MPKIRRSLHHAAVGINNFLKGFPKATKNLIEEFPSSINHFKSWAGTFRGRLTLVCLLGISLFPLISQDNYLLGIFISAMIFSIFAASWDFLAGIAGQVSFGQSAFFGIAGYVTAAFIRFLNFPWWFSIFIGAISSVGFGLIIGIPCLKLKGPYLALGTQVFALILFNLFMLGSLKDILGGTEGISQVPPLSNNSVIVFLWVLGFMVLSLVIMITIANSNLGTIFKSIRDDETAADASGINTTKYKILAFMISGFFAGLAGALFTLHNRGVNPGIYQPLYSFYAIVMASLGGIATISGSLLGAFIFVFLSEFLRDLAGVAIFTFSVILIIIIRFADRGIINPLLEHLKEFYDFLIGR